MNFFQWLFDKPAIVIPPAMTREETILLHEEIHRCLGIPTPNRDECTPPDKQRKPVDYGTLIQPEKNLIEIKLADTDSVPEIFYLGKKVDSALVDVSFYWKTMDDKSDGDCHVRVKFFEGMEEQTHTHNRI